MSKRKKRSLYVGLCALFFLALLYLFSGKILTSIGRFLVVDEGAERSDAVVVLFTGVEWYPRLTEAAALYREGYAEKVVVNGNRKSDTLRHLEQRGFQKCCPWYEDSMKILSLLGVPREAVMAVSAEDAYDTVSEAQVVGNALLQAGLSRIIVITSKSHTKRAGYVWKSTFSDQLTIRTVAARGDPYSPEGWWRDGRQIRWVLAEYGAWVYYLWKKMKG